MTLSRIIIAALIFTSCTNKKSESRNKRINEFQNQKGIEAENLLLHTQQIFQHYTAYLKSEDLNSKIKNARKLLSTLKNLDTLDYQNSHFGVVARINIDSSNYIQDVYLQTNHGIAWELQLDSLINSINRELELIKYTDF
jgi:hypothetical protein